MLGISNDLIIKASQGDMKAFEEIYRSAAGFVYNIAFRVAGNAKDAEEITQEVFIKVYKNLKGFGFRSSFKTWIYRITMNAAINFKKRISKEESRRIDYESVKDTVPSGKEREHDSKDLVSFLLDKLSPEHRACIVLKEIEGLSYEEISNALRININTVRSRLKRAREAMLEYAKKEVISNEV